MQLAWSPPNVPHAQLVRSSSKEVALPLALKASMGAQVTIPANLAIINAFNAKARPTPNALNAPRLIC